MFGFRKVAQAAAVSFALGAAGAAQAADKVTLDVGYLPIMPMAQLFVMEGEGWLDEAGIALEKTKFSSGPAIVQAIASGKMEMMWFGIGPAMVARANGVDIKVVAANVVEQVGSLARGRFAEIYERTGSAADAIRTFKSEAGRAVKIATLPKGSVPDIVLRYWLMKRLGVSLDDVEIVGMGAGRVQQALLSGAVDGASILEPVLTIVQDRVKDAKLMAVGGQLFPNQPGAVVAVRAEALAKKRAAIEKMVALHVRATALLKSDLKRAAKHVHAAIGAGLVPLELIEKSMHSPANTFISDPNQIVAATKVMHDFSEEIGALKKPVPLDKLFDTSLYDAAAAKK